MEKHIPIRFFLFILIGVCFPFLVFSQTEETHEKIKKLEVRGYVKDLQSLIFSEDFDELITGNLIHNRLNLRWKPTSKLTGAAEFRTRIFWGEEVKYTPDFSSGIGYNQDMFDASFIWFETNSMLMQTYIDRLWIEYQADKWSARIGRQRINWGICTFWNPNDIFNTYNFLDFDYEERPGRDAVSIRLNLNPMSYFEFAAAFADSSQKSVVGLKYFTNKWNYDFQFSGGVYQENLTLGAGWSGNIRSASFKGEFQYFPAQKDSTSQVNLTVESGYVFKNGWFLNLGVLLNNQGLNEPFEGFNPNYFQLSPRSLMPTKWNVVFTASKQITPLLSGSLSSIYSPGSNLIILLPTIQYSLANNLDFDFVWQSFFAEKGESMADLGHRGFLRIKWSF